MVDFCCLNFFAMKLGQSYPKVGYKNAHAVRVQMLKTPHWQWGIEFYIAHLRVCQIQYTLWSLVAHKQQTLQWRCVRRPFERERRKYSWRTFIAFFSPKTDAINLAWSFGFVRMSAKNFSYWWYKEFRQRLHFWGHKLVLEPLDRNMKECTSLYVSQNQSLPKCQSHLC